jgi:hypothetical protein
VIELRKRNQSPEIELVALIVDPAESVALLGGQKCSAIFFTLLFMMVKKRTHPCRHSLRKKKIDLVLIIKK